jgi:hypothetical protein
MNAILSAEQLFENLQQMPSTEREKFLLLLSAKAFEDKETFSHGEFFGHLHDEEFTAAEAAEYLAFPSPPSGATCRPERSKPLPKSAPPTSTGSRHCVN